MLNESLCDPCKKLLSGRSKEHGKYDQAEFYVHHQSAESFEQALGLQCPFCIRLWRAMNRSSTPCRTLFEKPCQEDFFTAVYTMRFYGVPQDSDFDTETMSSLECTEMQFVSAEGRPPLALAVAFE